MSLAEMITLAVVFLIILNQSSNAQDLIRNQSVELSILKPFRTTEARISEHDYPVETHYVETSDGYVLNIFRIPYSPRLKNQNSYRPAFLLEHGITSNSDCWIGSGPDNSLAYNLVDAGYDVWLGNARGNIYSRNNTRLSPNNRKFWHFSWHEIGTIDIATMIDYILEKTGQTAIHYTGHSQGTTVYLALMSTRPEYNQKIKTGHLLAPCAFMGYERSLILELVAPLVGTPSGLWYNLVVDTELFPKNAQINRLLDTICSIGTPIGNPCDIFSLAIGIEPDPRKNWTAISITRETYPGGASSNQAIHHVQLYVSHKFRQYDFGEKQNIKLYGTSTPPDYDLTAITASTYLYSSQNDAICGPPNVDTLVSHMKNLAGDYRIEDPLWDHDDFISNLLIKEVINDRVVDIANEYESNK